MFQVGQTVRLKRGWTPMIVIHIEDSGRIIAKYANSTRYPVTKKDYQEPYFACSTQKRQSDEFVVWDGKPINKKVQTIMPNRFKSKSMADVSGTLLNTTSRGDIVIEDDNGGVHVLSPSDAVRDIPFTVEVKSINSSYRCHYILSKDADVVVGDTLVSKSGNYYTVVRVNSECATPKGEFKGHRLVKHDL